MLEFEADFVAAAKPVDTQHTMQLVYSYLVLECTSSD